MTLVILTGPHATHRDSPLHPHPHQHPIPSPSSPRTPQTLGMRDLQAQLLRSGVEAGSLLEQLSEAQVNISEARHAASDHQSTMALLSRQVAALRVVLDEKISESEAKSEAAARKERDLVAEYEGERGRAESEAARALRAEFEAEVLRGELEAARRELTRFTGSDSEKCEAAAGAAREAALKEALAAAEMTGEELARILLDREEELTYYKRHCGALQQQVGVGWAVGWIGSLKLGFQVYRP